LLPLWRQRGFLEEAAWGGRARGSTRHSETGPIVLGQSNSGLAVAQSATGSMPREVHRLTAASSPVFLDGGGRALSVDAVASCRSAVACEPTAARCMHGMWRLGVMVRKGPRGRGGRGWTAERRPESLVRARERHTASVAGEGETSQGPRDGSRKKVTYRGPPPRGKRENVGRGAGNRRRANCPSSRVESAGGRAGEIHRRCAGSKGA